MRRPKRKNGRPREMGKEADSRYEAWKICRSGAAAGESGGGVPAVLPEQAGCGRRGYHGTSHPGGGGSPTAGTLRLRRPGCERGKGGPQFVPSLWHGQLRAGYPQPLYLRGTDLPVGGDSRRGRGHPCGRTAGGGGRILRGDCGRSDYAGSGYRICGPGHPVGDRHCRHPGAQFAEHDDCHCGGQCAQLCPGCPGLRPHRQNQ